MKYPLLRDLGLWPIQQKDKSLREGWRYHAIILINDKKQEIWSVCYSENKEARLNQLKKDIADEFPEFDFNNFIKGLRR